VAYRGIYFKLYQQIKDQEIDSARAHTPANAGGLKDPEVTATGDE
jgi:hypothetical protein